MAWKSLGWKPIAFSEIEKFPSDVLQAHFPNVPNLGDITKIDWSGYGSVDLIVGGSPCQSFSVAGKREGLAGESGLMFEYIRAVRCLMPRYFIWENVPGAFSSEKGEAYRQLLTEMDECGYGMAWRVLDAQFFGIPQRRRRVFLVGCVGNPKRAAEILFESEGLRWDFATSREQRENLTSNAGSSAEICYAIQGDIARGAHMGQNGRGWSDDGSSYTLNTIDQHAVVASNGRDYTGALCARDYKGVGNEFVNEGKVVAQDYAVRRLTPLECERLQGFPDGWTDIYEETPDTPRYKALGNSMAVPVMRWIGKRIETVN